MRVLIVDDEPDILLMLRLTLEAEGFDTALAADGEKALEQLSDATFDVMLVDVMMPVLDGWGVLEQRRALDAPPPVIVVSAKSSAADVQRAKELGASDYVTKPFSFPDLRRVIDEVTSRRRAS